MQKSGIVPLGVQEGFGLSPKLAFKKPAVSLLAFSSNHPERAKDHPNSGASRSRSQRLQLQLAAVEESERRYQAELAGARLGAKPHLAPRDPRVGLLRAPDPTKHPKGRARRLRLHPVLCIVLAGSGRIDGDFSGLAGGFV